MFRRVSEFIMRELGIRMGPAKLPLLQSRLQRRLRVTGCDTLEEYLGRVLDAPPDDRERMEFIDAVTTNKTDFLREPQHFELLAQVALPALAGDRKASWPFRVWSAGCSFGMEAYTLAMVLNEYAETCAAFDYAILGTDVSRRVLDVAQAGIYDAAAIEPVPNAWRRKYLLRSRDPKRSQVRIAPELRVKVRFERLNFMAATYAVTDMFDAIFFRNVMIYFDKPTQEQVVRKLCDRLRPGGYFFIGHSESLSGLSVPLHGVGSAVFRRV